MTNNLTPPVCNYEGSDYQQSFWDQGERVYEDRVESIALKRLLPSGGEFMLELGAGAGRNTLRYKNYKRVALLDYSRSQLEVARKRLGDSERFIFVAADVYRLPFVSALFDGATMIRTLHHMSDPVLALSQVHQVLVPEGILILEFANKRNLKAIFRYLFRKQNWSPYSQDPVEFAELNFDFHPKAIRRYLNEVGFKIEKQLTVSHFRVGLLKQHLPMNLLVGMDAFLQWSGSVIQVSPSVFIRCQAMGVEHKVSGSAIFRCPECETELGGMDEDLRCEGCGRIWEYRDGIYDFRLNPE